MELPRIERILCPVDFSESSVPAFAYASSLSCRLRAKLFAQYVVEMGRYPSADFAPTADGYDQFCATLICQGEARLRGFIQRNRAFEVDPECIVGKGMPADSILKFAEEKAINLIVIGTCRHGGIERLMLGSVAEKVFRTARSPVLVVPELLPGYRTSEGSKEGIEVRQIVACTDLTEVSNKVFDHGVSIAQDYHAGLTLLHVLKDIPPPGYVEDAAVAYKQLGELVSSQAKPNCKITTEVRFGKPYREIDRLAHDCHADLIIMAVRGHNSVNDAVFGSTSYRVIRSAACPVLAVRG